ncbi:hypothetical protein ILYODFUR_012138 [Ilyodon furcidens]|uniref:Uncharacterized protein n=1 Tax=Ilyodon furcidens TaxID=33524 RepID=A0ABV0VDB3_9TELE
MSQKPLEGIPDVDYLDSSEKVNLSLNHMSEKPEQSQKNQTSVPEAASNTKHALHQPSGVDVGLVVALLCRPDWMQIRSKQEVCLYLTTVSKKDCTVFSSFKLSTQRGVLENP